jgi:hypothetical protein
MGSALVNNIHHLNTSQVFENKSLKKTFQCCGLNKATWQHGYGTSSHI